MFQFFGSEGVANNLERDVSEITKTVKHNKIRWIIKVRNARFKTMITIRPPATENSDTSTVNAPNRNGAHGGVERERRRVMVEQH